MVSYEGGNTVKTEEKKIEATGYSKHEAILKPKPAKPQHTPDPIPQDYPDLDY